VATTCIDLLGGTLHFSAGFPLTGSREHGEILTIWRVNEMVRKKLTLILFTAALAQNLQLIKQRMAKAAQGGDLTNLVKVKTRKKHTWRVELLLVTGGGQDFLEDDFNYCRIPF
jgi:hypothetical protein